MTLPVARAGAPLQERVRTLYRAGQPALTRVWVTRAHPDDVITRPYHLCRVIQAPWQLQEDYLVNGITYEKGWYVCKIYWFEFIDEKPNGDQVFKMLSRPKEGEIISCNIICPRPIVKFSSYRGGRYVLDRVDHERVFRFGDLATD